MSETLTVLYGNRTREWLEFSHGSAEALIAQHNSRSAYLSRVYLDGGVA